MAEYVVDFFTLIIFFLSYEGFEYYVERYIKNITICGIVKLIYTGLALTLLVLEANCLVVYLYR